MTVLTEVPCDDGDDGPAVALTFDDGPGPHTPEVLEVLARYGVRATFFVCGAAVRRRPDLLRDVVAAGHLLGNHTFDHPQAVAGSAPYGDFDTLDAAVQADQVDRTAAEVGRALGRPAALSFFRGPGGHHHAAATRALTADRGMVVVGWAADSGDWQQPPGPDREVQDAIVHAATTAAARRPVVLLHDAKASAEPDDVVNGYRGNSVAALPRIVEAFGAAGYRFVPPDGAGWDRPAG